MLAFKEQICFQLGKTYGMTVALRRSGHFIPFETMRMAFILPHFEYCTHLLLGIGKGTSLQLLIHYFNEHVFLCGKLVMATTCEGHSIIVFTVSHNLSLLRFML